MGSISPFRKRQIFLREMVRCNRTCKGEYKAVQNGEQIELPFGVDSGVSPRNGVLDGHTYWYHLANMAERLCTAAMSGSVDAVCSQITYSNLVILLLCRLEAIILFKSYRPVMQIKRQTDRQTYTRTQQADCVTQPQMWFVNMNS